MEDIAYIILAGIGTLGVLLGGKMGLQWVKFRALDPVYVKKKVAFAEDLAVEYQADAKHWKGKYNATKSAVQIEGDFDLSASDGVSSAVKLVLPEILHLLPENVQKHAKGFLNNPEMVDMAVKLYEKHPEDIQRLLAGFLKKTGIKKQTGSDTAIAPTEEATIPTDRWA